MRDASFICNKHDKIARLASDLERLDYRRYDTVEDVISEVQSIAWDIRVLAEGAKEDGESMEARLIDYSSAMIGLGFTRNRE